jgi:hypothetical protein
MPENFMGIEVGGLGTSPFYAKYVTQLTRLPNDVKWSFT